MEILFIAILMTIRISVFFDKTMASGIVTLKDIESGKAYIQESLF